jgi:16S rRNA (guanine527-N7)-methyltransferase
MSAQGGSGGAGAPGAGAPGARGPGSDPAALLRDGLGQLRVPNPDRVHDLMERYLDELERWNPRFGLVKASGRGELVVKHVLDSLSAWRAVREAVPTSGATLLDVGSGAGLPGIPLAAALTDVSFTLLERMARRVSFLKTCGVLLGLPLLRVVQSDLSEAEGDFDVVTFRAVAPVDRFLSDLGASRVRWRTIIAYKGRQDRAREEIAAVREQAGAGVSLEIVPLHPPFLEEERCLLIVTHC